VAPKKRPLPPEFLKNIKQKVAPPPAKKATKAVPKKGGK
jgi:hypothetical protein